MSTKVTDLTALTTTPADGDELHIVDVSDTTGTAAGTSKRIDVSVLMGKAPVQSVNGDTGTVVLEMNDIDDVNAGSPSDNIVLSYDTATSKYIPDTRLTTLYDEFRTGTTTDVQNGASTDSKLELTATTAKMKTGVTEVKLTETSPGEIDFVVAAGASGSETAFTAVELDGTTTANEAELTINNGCKFLLSDGTYTAQLRPNSGAAADVNVQMPTKNGVLMVDVRNDSTPQLGGDLDVNGNKITSASNGDIDIEPNGTGDVLLGNFKFDADQSVGSGQDNYVLTYDDSTGKISLEEASGGGGGGVCTIATVTGQFRFSTSTDAGEDNQIAGGFRGANYYLWSNDVFTTANSVATGIGTPGTSTFSNGTGYNIMNGLFYVPQAGTAKFSVGMEFDNNSEVQGETIRFFMWKINSAEITALEGGTYDSAWSGVLVASASLTIPSTIQNITPMALQSSNGSSIAEGDYVFVTAVYDGTLTANREFPCNIVLYST